MAKTPAERQRERRQRNKTNPEEYEKYKSDERNRKRVAKERMTPAELRHHRVCIRKAVERFRNKSNNDAQGAQSSVYQTPASFGKAKRRVMKAMPRSPRKRQAIVKKLAVEILNADVSNFARNKVTSELDKAVRIFYENDSVSRMAPGKADCVTVCDDNGIKRRVQKRHLVMTLSEAYTCFKADHPEEEIGKSKFAALRPKWVFLSSDMPHNVCGCKYHNNVILLLEALHRKFSDVFPLYSKSDFTARCVCDTENDECMSDNCDQCCDLKIFDLAFNTEVSAENLICWSQWIQDDNNYIRKVETEGTTSDAVNELRKQLPRFFWHSFIKDKQANAYNIMKSSVMDDDSQECILQMDFAENFTCVSQDEIQSAHWKQRQVTLYTIMIYHRQHKMSYVIASDCRDQEKTSVAAFSSRSLELVAEKFPSVKSVQIWTDGPSSQYKNRYIFALIPKLQAFHQYKIQWNYFATSHGKGPNDGVGGNAKGVVHRMIMSRRATVYDAHTFVSAFQNSGADITMLTMTMQDISQRCKDLTVEAIWEGLQPFKGTITTHCALPCEDGTISLKHYTNAAQEKRMPISYAPAQAPTVVEEDVTEAVGVSSVETHPDVEMENMGSNPGNSSASDKDATTNQQEYKCPCCGWCYGDTNDPKTTDDWLRCKQCKVWFHETCGEDFGLIDDNEEFICRDCL